MNTKFAFSLIVLALAAMACGQQGRTFGERASYVSPTASSTPTAEPSLTPTSTPIPPTKSATPTRTPTPRISMAKVKEVGSNVIIRDGPCYQTPIANAQPGQEFPVIGWFRSPHSDGEEWLLIEFRNGTSDQAWVRADLVEVTNTDLVPPAFANCPPTITPTIEEPPSLRDTYIRLYRHSGFSGDFLDIWLTDCGAVDIVNNSHFHDSISSFELFAPDNVEVILAEHRFSDDRFPGKSGRARGNNKLMRVDVAELKEVGLQNEISSVIWLVDGQREPTICQR